MQRPLTASFLPALALATSALCATSFLSNGGADWDDGADWPGWLGAGHGVVTKGTPPTEWSEELNVKWKIKVPGKGLSSPVVVNGTIYLTTAVQTEAGKEAADKKAEEEAKRRAEEEEARANGGDGQRGGRGRGRRGGGMRMTTPTEHEFLVMAYDFATGELKWSKTAATLTPHAGTHSDGSFATPTVAVDGDRLYASFGSYGIFAYDLKGKQLWSKDLGDMRVQGNFGEGSSPVVAGGNVIILWGHEGESFVVALDGKTGNEVWRQNREKGTAWLSPAIARVGDEEQVIIVGTSTQAYAAKTGNLIWSVGGDGGPKKEADNGQGRGRRSQGGPIATPLIDDGCVYTTVGGRRSSFIVMEIESDATDEGLDSERIVWMHEGDTPRIPTPLIIDGTLYSMKGNSGILSAFDSLTGEPFYTGERLKGVSDAYASPVAAGGNIYLTGRDGTFEVVRAGEEFVSIAVNNLDDRFDATPAIIGDTLLLRGFEHLYCIAASK